MVEHMTDETCLWVCRKCGKEKPFEDFKLEKGNRFQRTRLCKECNNRYFQEWSKLHHRDRHGETMTEEDRIKNRRRSREYYQTHREEKLEKGKLYKKAPKGLARTELRLAVLSGKIRKPSSCQKCGKVVQPSHLHGHHEDYSMPLQVEWLCSICHGDRHQTLPRKEAKS